MLAAPALVNTVALTLYNVGGGAGIASLSVALALIAVLALVIDRRSFLTAAIGYIAVLIGWIVRGEDGDFGVLDLRSDPSGRSDHGAWHLVGAAAGGADARAAELSGQGSPAPLCGDSMTTLTPREIVSELDRYIIGQKDAKRAVAVAMRNRWRRKQLADDLRDEVYPKNILMIGPTGVGKTEISRRLAKLAKAPFLKVEATKFTEVGYVGRDVDSIIRDLVDAAIVETRAQMRDEVKAKAHRAAEERVIEALAGKDAREQTREMFRGKLKRGELDDDGDRDWRWPRRRPPCRCWAGCPAWSSRCRGCKTCSARRSAGGQSASG